MTRYKIGNVGDFAVADCAVGRAHDFAFRNYVPERDAVLSEQRLFLFRRARKRLTEKFRKHFPETVGRMSVIEALFPGFDAWEAAQNQNVGVFGGVRWKSRDSHTDRLLPADRFVNGLLPRGDRRRISERARTQASPNGDSCAGAGLLLGGDFGFALGAEDGVFHGYFVGRTHTVAVESAIRRALNDAVVAATEKVFARFDVSKGLRKRAALSLDAAQTFGRLVD